MRIDRVFFFFDACCSRLPGWAERVCVCKKGRKKERKQLGRSDRDRLTYWIPMHILDPLLKGRKAVSMLLFSPGSAVSQREGRKVRGEGKMVGSWRASRGDMPM